MPYLWEKEEFCHTLIVSAPRCGKTTLLRDVIRQISDGSRRRRGLTVGVVDERSEIAGACRVSPRTVWESARMCWTAVPRRRA